jgi:hypothetical protein
MPEVLIFTAENPKSHRELAAFMIISERVNVGVIFYGFYMFILALSVCVFVVHIYPK